MVCCATGLMEKRKNPCTLKIRDGFLTPAPSTSSLPDGRQVLPSLQLEL